MSDSSNHYLEDLLQGHEVLGHLAVLCDQLGPGGLLLLDGLEPHGGPHRGGHVGGSVDDLVDLGSGEVVILWETRRGGVF